MKNLSKKGIIILSCIILVLLVLFIVGIFTMPVYATIESTIMLLSGIFFGWLIKSVNKSDHVD